MTNKEIKDFIIREGFVFDDYDDDDEQIEKYEYIGMDVCLHKKNQTRYIQFSYSEIGYCTIKNPTIEQIKNMIDLYKSSQFFDFDNAKETPRELYKRKLNEVIAEKIESFLQEKFTNKKQNQ